MYLKGVCEKTIQDVVERFWDIIEEINVAKTLRFLKDNIVSKYHIAITKIMGLYLHIFLHSGRSDGHRSLLDTHQLCYLIFRSQEAAIRDEADRVESKTRPNTSKRRKTSCHTYTVQLSTINMLFLYKTNYFFGLIAAYHARRSPWRELVINGHCFYLP